MGAFQGGNDALAPHDLLQGSQDLGVRGGLDPDAADIVQMRQNGTDANVIQARRHRMGVPHLPFDVLQEACLVALRDPGGSYILRQPGGVPAAVQTQSAGLDPHQFHFSVVQKAREDPRGIRSAAYAGINFPGQLTGLLEHLRTGLAADERLEVGDHLREGVRTAYRAHDVVGRVHGIGPVPQGGVDGVFQRLGAVVHGHHAGAQLLHPEDVWPLPFHVHRPHVDRALEAHARCHGGSSHAVLPGSRFRDYPLFSHALHQQALPHDVVDLVGAGVVQVFALDVYLRATQVLAQILQVGQRRGPAGIARHQVNIGVPEGPVGLGVVEGRRQFADGLVEDFRDEGAAKLPIIALAAGGKLE